MTESRPDDRGDAADREEDKKGSAGATLGWRPASFTYRSLREPGPVRPNRPGQGLPAKDPESSPSEPSSDPANHGKIL